MAEEKKFVDQQGVVRLWGHVKTLATEIKDDVKQVKKDVYDLHAGASITVSPTVFEKNQSTEVTVTWKSLFKGAQVTPVSTSVKNNTANTVVSTANNSQAKVTLTAGAQFGITTVIVDGVTKTNTATVQAVFPKYYGSSAKASITVDDIVAPGQFVKQPVATGTAGSASVNVKEGEYMWLCVPDGMKINTVKSSGFDVPMEKPIVVATKQSGNYNCYRSSSTYKAGTVNIVIA